MDIEELLNREKELIALLGILKADSISDAALKIFAVRQIISNFAIGEKIDEEEMISLLQEYPSPISDDRILSTVIDLKLLQKQGDNLNLHSDIPLANWYPNDAKFDLKCGFSELNTLIKKTDKSRIEVDISPSIEDCIDRIFGTIEWASEITLCSLSRGLKGIPVFWEEQSDQMVAQGDLPASGATIDTGTMQLEFLLSSIHTEQFRTKMFLERIVDLSNMIQSYQITDIEENALYDIGGLFIENDDDFPGTTHPIVDSTANGIHFFCQMIKCWREFNLSNIIQVNMEEMEQFIHRGANFLLNMQLPEGGWGLYRYPNDKYKMPSLTNSCRYALIAIGDVISLDILKKEEQDRIYSNINKFIDFIDSRANHTGDQLYWTVNLSPHDKEDVESLYATMRIVQGLIKIYCVSKSFRSVIEPLIHKGIRYIQYHWKPEPSNISSVEFRVPTEQGPDDLPMIWRDPADPHIVYTLLDYSKTFDTSLLESTEKNIENAVAYFLATQINNKYWIEPANKWASPPNSYIYIHAMLLYSEIRFQKLRDLFVDKLRDKTY